MLAHHPCEILPFDFAKAFDKAPHSSILTAVTNIGVGGQALDWLGSYLTNSTFRVRVGSSLSSSADATSGVNQGSCVGPTLYRIFIDFLLRKISLPSETFADDLKFIIDVAINPRDAVQKEVNLLSDWATLYGTPLSVEKCTVLHCGPHQLNHTYYINSVAITSTDSVKDLGIRQSKDGTYTEHCNNVISWAASKCAVLRRIFPSRHRNLLWPAFVSYVLPVLSYYSPIWPPFLKRDINALESIQRQFTKKISGLSGLPYNDRLRELGALTLEHRRRYTDMVTVYKYLHGLVDDTPSSVGIQAIQTTTRGSGTRLKQQHTKSRVYATVFRVRATQCWNKLSLPILNSNQLVFLNVHIINIYLTSKTDFLLCINFHLFTTPFCSILFIFNLFLLIYVLWGISTSI